MSKHQGPEGVELRHLVEAVIAKPWTKRIVMDRNTLNADRNTQNIRRIYEEHTKNIRRIGYTRMFNDVPAVAMHDEHATSVTLFRNHSWSLEVFFTLRSMSQVVVWFVNYGILITILKPFDYYSTMAVWCPQWSDKASDSESTEKKPTMNWAATARSQSPKPPRWVMASGRLSFRPRLRGLRGLRWMTWAHNCSRADLRVLHNQAWHDGTRWDKGMIRILASEHTHSCTFWISRSVAW